MSLLSRLEKKFGRYVVPNLTAALVAGQALVYLANFLQGGRGAVLENIWLVPDAVMAGEVWRVVTFLFQPPSYQPTGFGLIFLFFYWYLLYFFGTTLEQQWGTFRFNLYILIGWLATVAVAFVLPPWSVTNAYLYTSLFLAFAHLYPNFELRLFFILPIKVKWLALFTWLMFLLRVVQGGWPEALLVGATVADYLLFFGYDVYQTLYHFRRRQKFHNRIELAKKKLVHECHVCGMTSEMAPRMQFRYCGACDGETCFCPDHINDHQHVVGERGQESEVGD